MLSGTNAGESRSSTCTVKEAAALLGGCSAQTVRNLIHRGELHGDTDNWGQRPVWKVHRESITDYLNRHGSPARAPASHKKQTAGQLNDIERRLQRLEAEPPVTPTETRDDQVNLQVANLRLMQIHEDYHQALHEMLTADQHREQAVKLFAQVAADYRAALQQFHLPPGPP